MMNKLYETMLSHRDDTQVAGLLRFFKTGHGQYGEGDKFLGIKVPVTREVVKTVWKDLTFEDLEECVSSEYHEIRLAALLVLVQMFRNARKPRKVDFMEGRIIQQRCVDFYLSHTQYVNNWDLVDLSCYEILGQWLLDKDRAMLYDYARNGATVWEQRIGIVSTMAFLRNGELDDTYAIADIFIEKPAPLHDLLQKATGWLVREAGKRDMDRLREWLMPRCKSMPRTMLRYAIEKMPEDERRAYLK